MFKSTCVNLISIPFSKNRCSFYGFIPLVDVQKCITLAALKTPSLHKSYFN